MSRKVPTISEVIIAMPTPPAPTPSFRTDTKCSLCGKVLERPLVQVGEQKEDWQPMTYLLEYRVMAHPSCVKRAMAAQGQGQPEAGTPQPRLFEEAA